MKWFVLLLISASAWAGNGSSGVGSASIPIVEGLAAALPEGFVQSDGAQVRDGESAILKVAPIAKSELQGKWVESRLGAVDGYEFVPEIGSPEKNSWAVCRPQGCVRMTPLSARNPKIPAVIGSLIKN